MSERLIGELAKALEHDAEDPALCDLVAIAGKDHRDLKEATRILRMAALNPLDAQTVAQDFINRTIPR